MTQFGRAIRDTEPLLEDRVDKYGERQRAGIGAESRARGRGDPEDAPGWWYQDEDGDWTFHGDGELPSEIGSTS